MDEDMETTRKSLGTFKENICGSLKNIISANIRIDMYFISILGIFQVQWLPVSTMFLRCYATEPSKQMLSITRSVQFRYVN